MNNHWHTNFPQTQEGKVTFAYRMMPHGALDVASVNRFGMAQAQPLVHVLAKNASEIKAPVAIDNPNVVVSVVKDGGDGKIDDCPPAFGVRQGGTGQCFISSRNSVRKLYM